MTLGSLFDGSGGFPLGAILCGITPVWAVFKTYYTINGRKLLKQTNRLLNG